MNIQTLIVTAGSVDEIETGTAYYLTACTAPDGSLTDYVLSDEPVGTYPGGRPLEFGHLGSNMCGCGSAQSYALGRVEVLDVELLGHEDDDEFTPTFEVEVTAV